LTTGKGCRELLVNIGPGNDLMVDCDARVGIGEGLQQGLPEIGFFLAVRRLPERTFSAAAAGAADPPLLAAGAAGATQPANDVRLTAAPKTAVLFKNWRRVKRVSDISFSPCRVNANTLD